MTSQPWVTQGLFVSEVSGPDPPPLHPLYIFPAIPWTFKHSLGAFPLPLGLMGPELGSPHSAGRWELVAWHHVGRPGHGGSRHQRRGKESHFSRAAISKPAAPTANPVWALFPTLVSLAPLTDDPVPTLLLAQLQGSPEVKSGDQGSPRIRWWVVLSLKCIQLPAWWGSPCPN